MSINNFGKNYQQSLIIKKPKFLVKVSNCLDKFGPNYEKEKANEIMEYLNKDLF